MLRSSMLVAFGLMAVACGADPGDPTPLDRELANGPGQDDVTPAGDDGEDAVLVGADEALAGEVPEATKLLAADGSLRTTANLNLRASPSTSSAVLLVIPEGAVVHVAGAPSGSFYRVEWSGTAGWAHGAYLAPAASSPSGDALEGSPSPELALARARSSVGFSYWWGGGAWLPSGPTATTAGSCTGECPSCTHRGTYGADCSGMLAKVWSFGPSALEEPSHPYSTATFATDVAGKWSTIARSDLRPGDALVYNDGRKGHIVLWEKSDSWGGDTVYECRGCAYGCVHNTRTFGSPYKAIRRAGF